MALRSLTNGRGPGFAWFWRMHHRHTILPFLCALLASAGHLSAGSSVDVAAPTTSWTVIRYSNNNPDPSNDQQTGSSEGDIVGNLAHPSAYMMFGDAGTPSLIDGTLGFRVRLGADVSPLGFKTAFFVGIDANNDGALDLFLGVNNSGSKDTIGIWSPGTGLNISPSTTTIGNTPLVSYTQTSANYSWMAVDAVNDPSVGGALDIDGGGQNDYFLSFSIQFSDVVTQLAARGITGFDQNSQISFVLATSTQGNSLNQDLNGVGKTYDPAATWSSLGVLTANVSSSGIYLIPEPRASMLLIVGTISLLAYGARRSRA